MKNTSNIDVCKDLKARQVVVQNELNTAVKEMDGFDTDVSDNADDDIASGPDDENDHNDDDSVDLNEVFRGIYVFTGIFCMSEVEVLYTRIVTVTNTMCCSNKFISVRNLTLS